MCRRIVYRERSCVDRVEIWGRRKRPGRIGQDQRVLAVFEELDVDGEDINHDLAGDGGPKGVAAKREEGEEQAIEEARESEGEILLKTVKEGKQSRLKEDCEAQIVSEVAEVKEEKTAKGDFLGDAGGDGDEPGNGVLKRGIGVEEVGVDEGLKVGQSEVDA